MVNMQKHDIVVKRRFKDRARVWAESRRRIGNLLRLFVTLVVVSSLLFGCARVHRFHVVRYTAETTTSVLSGQGRNLHQLESDGVRVTFQRAYAYADWTRNPGAGLTLILENTTSEPVQIDSREIAFSCFPPRDPATQTGITPVYVSVEPAEKHGEVWEIAARTTAKVHVAFRSPSHTPGYVRLVVQKGNADEKAVFSFKVARVPPTNS